MSDYEKLLMMLEEKAKYGDMNAALVALAISTVAADWSIRRTADYLGLSRSVVRRVVGIRQVDQT